MVDQPVEGITQDLARGNNAVSTMEWYQGRYFVCETINKSAAKRVAEALGWNWSKTPIQEQQEKPE